MMLGLTPNDFSLVLIPDTAVVEKKKSLRTGKRKRKEFKNEEIDGVL